ncbi:MAG: hypothetical protein FRX48_06366 [Lasallia pustulata]|uniref:Uncharacterized protein n=1 Tax=Lasallia pustulata TaxID=136370 RepID=A0A5M8PMN8_9LECA|nr:MAG: hypothetical protein FRX48_06366 [Lasallia pustulata]
MGPRLPSYDEATKENALFVEALERYENSADEKFKTHINIHQSQTWDDVLKEVSNAEDKYKNEDVKGFWGSIRKGFRKFGENHQRMDWTSSCRFTLYLCFVWRSETHPRSRSPPTRPKRRDS